MGNLDHESAKGEVKSRSLSLCYVVASAFSAIRVYREALNFHQINQNVLGSSNEMRMICAYFRV